MMKDERRRNNTPFSIYERYTGKKGDALRYFLYFCRDKFKGVSSLKHPVWLVLNPVVSNRLCGFILLFFPPCF
jgi:hypothetical protein